MVSIGDQMGCGKTRVIALIIAETASIVPQGKLKCLWLSAKPQLQPDAEKELREIDCSLQFITNDSSPEASKGIIFAAYSSLSRGNDHNRLFGIAKWLDEECLVCLIKALDTKILHYLIFYNSTVLNIFWLIKFCFCPCR